jgi:hypothetical protein
MIEGGMEAGGDLCPVCVYIACLFKACFAAGTCISYTPFRSVPGARMLSQCGRGAIGIIKTSYCGMRMSDDLATFDSASSVPRIPGTTSTSRVVAVVKVGRVAGLVAVARVVLEFATVTSVQLRAVR